MKSNNITYYCAYLLNVLKESRVFFGLEHVFAFGQWQQIPPDTELQTQHELLLGREKLMNPPQLRVHIAG